jgi:hypothetical protein
LQLIMFQRPHLSVSAKPPYETVAGLLAVPLDKFRDKLRVFPPEAIKKMPNACIIEPTRTTYVLQVGFYKCSTMLL